MFSIYYHQQQCSLVDVMTFHGNWDTIDMGELKGTIEGWQLYSPLTGALLFHDKAKYITCGMFVKQEVGK